MKSQCDVPPMNRDIWTRDQATSTVEYERTEEQACLFAGLIRKVALVPTGIENLCYQSTLSNGNGAHAHTGPRSEKNDYFQVANGSIRW